MFDRTCKLKFSDSTNNIKATPSSQLYCENFAQTNSPCSLSVSNNQQSSKKKRKKTATDINTLLCVCLLVDWMAPVLSQLKQSHHLVGVKPKENISPCSRSLLDLVIYYFRARGWQRVRPSSCWKTPTASAPSPPPALGTWTAYFVVKILYLLVFTREKKKKRKVDFRSSKF